MFHLVFLGLILKRAVFVADALRAVVQAFDLLIHLLQLLVDVPHVLVGSIGCLLEDLKFWN